MAYAHKVPGVPGQGQSGAAREGMAAKTITDMAVLPSTWAVAL